MRNLEKYKNVFTETLGIGEDGLEDLVYEAISAWDSVGHMNLITALEDTFGIMIETEDIVDFSSFKKGIEMLKKYDVEI